MQFSSLLVCWLLWSWAVTHRFLSTRQFSFAFRLLANVGPTGRTQSFLHSVSLGEKASWPLALWAWSTQYVAHWSWLAQLPVSPTAALAHCISTQAVLLWFSGGVILLFSWCAGCLKGPLGGKSPASRSPYWSSSMCIQQLPLLIASLSTSSFAFFF